MRLRFGDDMLLLHRIPFKGQAITRVPIRVDRTDFTALRLHFPIQTHRCFNALSNAIGNNATFLSTISSPYDCPLMFF